MTIYPVEGRWVPDVPAVEQDVDPVVAQFLIETGGFTDTPAPQPVAEG